MCDIRLLLGVNKIMVDVVGYVFLSLIVIFALACFYFGFCDFKPTRYVRSAKDTAMLQECYDRLPVPSEHDFAYQKLLKEFKKYINNDDKK
jgi:hypothetical protein